MNPILKVKKLHPDAIIPSRGSVKSSGLDLYALEDTVIEAGSNKIVKTGIAFEIPEGYEIQIRPRSGVSLKTNLIIRNSPGTVDQDYLGEACVIVGLLSEYGTALTIKKGERIAQAVLAPVAIPELVVVDVFSTSTERGSSGFGSTGS